MDRKRRGFVGGASALAMLSGSAGLAQQGPAPVSAFPGPADLRSYTVKVTFTNGIVVKIRATPNL